jgi:hypothetical protein
VPKHVDVLILKVTLSTATMDSFNNKTETSGAL